ncbi:hypothetical protein [Brachybacterium sp. FME24]|uniref:hypothetical protein n=1 Tax=Brachybacterium sp. FME24 TaxID=2742605 RepID=UPI001867630D|nr:hypothetical protein [Brachybacterium sp. FME24]
MTNSEHEVVAIGDGEVAETSGGSLEGAMRVQDSDAVAFAAEFLKKIIRIRGVRIDRSSFLPQELRKLGLDQEVIDRALATSPVQAGVSLAQLDELAGASISFETSKAVALSFSAGLPGGFAMFATVPADITQYYVHAFRVMQKLAYFYGWQNFIADLDDVDDETLGKLAVFLGVMMGVGGASASLTSFAAHVARPAIQKQITQKALTKTVWYGPMKSTLKLIGIKVTKDSFAKTVTKAVPVAGGVISGGMTLVSLRTQSGRLKQHLRELPPPGVDAAEYRGAVIATDEEAAAGAGRLTAARENIESAAGDAASGMKGFARGAWGSANAAGSGALRRGRTIFDKSRKGERSSGASGAEAGVEEEIGEAESGDPSQQDARRS